MPKEPINAGITGTNVPVTPPISDVFKPLSCLNGEPFMKLGEGNAPILNYQLPVTSEFDVDGVFIIPIPTDAFGNDFPPKNDNHLWNIIKSLSYDDVLKEVLAVLQGSKGKNGIFLNTHLLKGMVLLEPANFSQQEIPTRGYAPNHRVAKPQSEDKYLEYQTTCKKCEKTGVYKTPNGKSISPKLIDPYEIATQIKEGNIPIFRRKPSGMIDIEYKRQPRYFYPRISMILHYRVATYARDYGASKTVATFSLLPGEKTTISMRSYSKRESTRISSYNVLDSLNEYSASSFENLLQNETLSQSTQQSSENQIMNQSNTVGSTATGYHSGTHYDMDTDTESWEVGGNIMGVVTLPGAIIAGAIKGGYSDTSTSGSGNSSTSGDIGTQYQGIVSGSNHQTTFNEVKGLINNAIQNTLNKAVTESTHAREVEINTTTSETFTTENENATVRELSNINYSRVLNFVFRQLSQKYLCITYLNDVSFVYTNGDPSVKYTVGLDGLENLLLSVIKNPEDAAMILTNILMELCNFTDWQGNTQKFAICEDRTITSCCGEEPITVTQHLIHKNPTLVQRVEDIAIKGVVVDVRDRILPTEHVVCDALLGQGEALDCYNQRLQEQGAYKAELMNYAIKMENEMRYIELQNYTQQVQIQLQNQQLELDKATQEFQTSVQEQQLALQEKQLELDKQTQDLNLTLQEKQLEFQKIQQAIAILDAITDPLQKAEFYKKVFGTCCDTPQTQIIA